MSTTRGDSMIVVSPEDAPMGTAAGAAGTEMAVLLGTEQGAPRFVLRRFRVAPGGRIPLHAHDDIEHEQFILSGELVARCEGGERTVRAGDAVFVPARTAHGFENRSETAAEFLCVVPLTAEYATQWLEAPVD